jgi:serine phosphatase RsbU (regulator of sigma subunit)
MSLLFFNYLLTGFLFFFSYFLDSRSERNNTLFTGMIMVGAFITLFSGLTAHLFYTGNLSISAIFFKLCLATLAFYMVSLFKFSFAVPYFAKNAFLDVLGWLLFLFSLYLSFFTINSLKWIDTDRYFIKSGMAFNNMKGLTLYTAIYIIGVPAVSFLTLVFRGIGIRSRIYRQRILFVAVSVCVGFVVSILLYKLSLRYFWAFPLIPFGLAIMLALIYQSISITTLFDRSLVLASIINFIVLSLVFSLATAFITAAIIGMNFSPVAVAASLIAVAVVMLTIQGKVAIWLRRYIRVGTDYRSDLETGLDALDFASGGQEILEKTVSLLIQHVDCASVDILVSDDKGKLVTVYSTMNAKNEVSVENKAIEFLLNRNETLVLKTQAITKHIYQEVKADLLKLFEIGHSDAFMLLREGHRVVGIIFFGTKKRGADYTEYDYEVLSELYSNLFLVMYYLKNIAHESVMLTIDREIEFSGQIITGIQDNIDRITHEKIDVDFITKSARKLGGDFIDFIKLSDDKSLFVMGDVSGKGLNASMSMVILKSIFRTLLNETGDFKKLVIKVNSFVKNNLPKGTFFAGIFGLMDFSNNTLYYINCGVPTMFLYTAAYNNANEIQGEGRVLGFVRDITPYVKVKKITLNPEDIILMTTDGLVDSTNLRGERFGKDRVQRLLIDNRSYPAGRMAKFLCDNLGEFVSRELEDDITVLVLKYLKR